MLRLSTYEELFDDLTLRAYEDCMRQAEANNIGLMLTQGSNFILEEFDEDDRIKEVEVVAVAFAANKIYVLTADRVSEKFQKTFDAFSVNDYNMYDKIEMLNKDNGLYVFHNTNDTKKQEHRFWTLETYMHRYGGPSIMLAFIHKFKDALENTRF